MKTILALVVFISCSLTIQAQCPEGITGKEMQKGMLIHCYLEQEEKKYVAEVTAVDGTSFSCRFLHSNSTYQFKDLKKIPNTPSSRMQATVQSNKGGGYAAGTVFRVNIYMPDPEPCDLSTAKGETVYDIIATFPDKKSFLGRTSADNNGYTMQFAHTNSRYVTDKNFKVTKVTGGGYPVGTQLSVVHARILQFPNQ